MGGRHSIVWPTPTIDFTTVECTMHWLPVTFWNVPEYCCLYSPTLVFTVVNAQLVGLRTSMELYVPAGMPDTVPLSSQQYSTSSWYGNHHRCQGVEKRTSHWDDSQHGCHFPSTNRIIGHNGTASTWICLNTFYFTSRVSSTNTWWPRHSNVSSSDKT